MPNIKKIAENRIDMMQLVMQAKQLSYEGNQKVALELLDKVIAVSADIRDLLFAAGLATGILEVHGAQLYGTQEALDTNLLKYAKITLKCFDAADQASRQDFQDMGVDVDVLRNAVSDIEKSKCVKGENKMSEQTNANLKVAISLLESVEGKIKQSFGNLVAIGPAHEYDADVHFRCKKLLEEIDAAVKKVNVPEVSAFAAYLRGRLYAIHGTLVGTRFTHNRAIKEYEQALQLGAKPEMIGYYLGHLYAAWDDRQKAIESFRKTVDVLGVDDPMGLEAAQEIAKLEAKKKSGCFIATAAYGTDVHKDIAALYAFRDCFLLQSRFGRLFVRLYYRFSPSIARIIAQSQILRWTVRIALIMPIAALYRRVLAHRTNKDNVRKDNHI